MAYTPDQVAQAFIDEGMRRGVNPIGIQEAICAGLDESGLRVLANPADPASEALPNDGDGFDHASEGPLQQQPPWWGTVECRMDPTCSVGMFYDHLVALPTGYTDFSAHTPGWYIQQVQQSFDATGNNYMAQWNTAIAIYNRLHGSTEGPGIPQANVDLAISIFKARIGDEYVFGGAYSPDDVKQGTDCSGMCDTILQALTHGPGMQWGRHVSTESWPYNYPQDLAVAVGTIGPYGTICAGDAQPGPGAVQGQIPTDAAAIVYLMHGGGGENSHMMIAVNDGTGNYIVMETGGAHNDTGGNGQYASANGPATSTTDPEWTDIWYLPGPIGGSTDMDASQNQMLTDLHSALCVEGVSQSPFRALGEGAKWTVAQLGKNMDGFIHPKDVEWKAERGSTSDLALLETLAAANPLQYPDRAQDITLAQTVLARVNAVLSGQTPPNVVGPAPVNVVTPTPTPDVVTPQPTPAAPTISTAQLMQWGRDATTILGVLGTWATALHGVLGQYLSGSSATVVPTILGGATVAAGFSTVHHKNQLLRENRVMKSLAPQRYKRQV
jgi:hypothetical protein